MNGLGSYSKANKLYLRSLNFGYPAPGNKGHSNDHEMELLGAAIVLTPLSPLLTYAQYLL